MNLLTRRRFLRSTAVLAAAATLRARSWAEITGANSDVRVAVIGLNGRGKEHLRSLRALRGVRIAAICDVDTAVLEKTAADLAKDGLTPEKFSDLRALLASPNVDAVTIATPNHWHALGAIWACEAGKDVYLEKPVSHNIWEGRQLVAAAKKSNRIVQAGVQIRSGAGLQEAVQWVRAGHLGKVTVARGFCYKRRKSIGLSAGPTPPPVTVDYDQWLGPAAFEQPHRTRFHYDWHWFNAYGNGDVGNQGIHQMDVARWFLGDPGFPELTLSLGGRLGYHDDGQTPNTQVVYHHYADAPLVFEVRGLPATRDPNEGQIGAVGAEAAGALAGTMDQYRGVSIGNVIECEGGSLVTTNYFTATAHDRDGKVVREFKGVDRHMENFIDTVRSRKPADLFGPIEQGHLSSALCHLGGISHQLGHPSPVKLTEGDGPLSDALRRLDRHLQANEIDLEKTPLILGERLRLDPSGEHFLEGKKAAPAVALGTGLEATPGGAKAANAKLTREYRAGYAVPRYF